MWNLFEVGVCKQPNINGGKRQNEDMLIELSDIYAADYRNLRENIRSIVVKLNQKEHDLREKLAEMSAQEKDANRIRAERQLVSLEKSRLAYLTLAAQISTAERLARISSKQAPDPLKFIDQLQFLIDNDDCLAKNHNDVIILSKNSSSERAARELAKLRLEIGVEA